MMRLVLSLIISFLFVTICLAEIEHFEKGDLILGKEGT